MYKQSVRRYLPEILYATVKGGNESQFVAYGYGHDTPEKAYEEGCRMNEVKKELSLGETVIYKFHGRVTEAWVNI